MQVELLFYVLSQYFLLSFIFCLHFVYTESTSWNISVVSERLCLILWSPSSFHVLSASTKAIRYCEQLRMKTGLQGNILSTLKLHLMLLLPFCWNMCCIFLEPCSQITGHDAKQGWFLGLVFSVRGVVVGPLNDARIIDVRENTTDKWLFLIPSCPKFPSKSSVSKMW